MACLTLALPFLAACTPGATPEIFDSSPAACLEGGVYEVTTTEDVVLGPCNTHCTLREALKAANECPGYQTVRLPAGDYALSVAGSGDDRGDLNVVDSVEIIGVSSGDTTIRGSNEWGYRIFEIGEGVSARLRGLTIQGGHPADGDDGGGILNHGSLELDDVVLIGNVVRGNGGGLFSDGSASLRDVTVLGNRASPSEAGSGGSLPPACGGGVASLGSLEIMESQIRDNLATHGAGICLVGDKRVRISGATIHANGQAPSTNRGGGIYADAPLTVEATQVTGNHALGGGGIYFTGRQHGLRVSGSFVDSNQAHTYVPRPGGVLLAGDGSGGGLLLEDLAAERGAIAAIHNSVISGNLAERSGGGLQLSGSADYGTADPLGSEIVGTAIVNNQATANGGGIHHLSGSLRLINSTVGNNLAQGDGGGLLFVINSGRLHLWHATVANNIPQGVFNAVFVPVGGGAGRGLFIEHSLIAMNEVNCENRLAEIVSLGWNVEDRDQCGLTHPEDRAGVGREALDPHLVYGGGSAYFEPLTQAVNFITDRSRCPAADQIGTRRPSPPDGGCDAGAIETELQFVREPILSEEQPSDDPQATAVRNASCRKGPGTRFDVHAFLLAGETAPIDGRNADQTWVWLLVPNVPGRCWVSTTVLEITGVLDLAPTVPSPLPPAQATPPPSQGPDDCGPNEYWSIETQSCQPFG